VAVSQTFRTTDIDETRRAIGDAYYANFIDLLGSARDFRARFDIAEFGAFTVGDLSCGADLRVRCGELGSFHVNVPLTGHIRWRQGSQPENLTTEGRGAVFQPVGNTTVERWSGDSRLLAVKIDRIPLERQLARLLGRPLDRPLVLAPELDVTQGPGRSWVRMLRRTVQVASEGDSLINHPLMAGQVEEALLTGLLLATGHRHHEELALPRAPMRPAPVKRAMDAMQENPEHPFDTAELAAIAGVSVRWLQEAFRRYAGTTPLGHLREVRLDRVHAELRHADPAALTVSEVAWRWGFTHLGRFAAQYRERFGEPPSQTLRNPDRPRAQRIAVRSHRD
jgi:AraC-like DNA-binding protein